MFEHALDVSHCLSAKSVSLQRRSLLGSDSSNDGGDHGACSPSTDTRLVPVELVEPRIVVKISMFVCTGTSPGLGGVAGDG